MLPRSLGALAGNWRACEQLDEAACESVASGDEDGAYHATRLLVGLLRQLHDLAELPGRYDDLGRRHVEASNRCAFLSERLRSVERLAQPVADFLSNPMRVQ